MPRLLVCRECQTIETLPLYDGPAELEAQDPILDNVVRRHVQKHGDLNPEAAALLVAPEGPCNCGEKTTVDVTGRIRAVGSRVRGPHTFWEGHRDDILKGLQERWTGFHPEYYATVDTYKEDAARCYNLHRRPKGTDCIDWRADNRRLTDDNRDKDKHIYLCFAGETRFLTPFGAISFSDAVEQGSVTVLTADRHNSHQGWWETASIQEFGAQALVKVTLRRNKQTKIVHATPDHRWATRWPDRLTPTLNLSRGQQLAHVRAEKYVPSLDLDGVRRGIHFGDGSVQFRDHRTYGTLTLWGEKMELEPYFSDLGPGRLVHPEGYQVDGLRHTSGMKGYVKEVPALGDANDLGYYYSWLAGYFAADGSVSPSGQMILTSAYEENLAQVRDLCALLGIGTYGVTSHVNRNRGIVPAESPLFKLGFARNDLTPEFFLRSRHRANWSPGAYERFGWTVEGVEPTDRVEPVYCVTVPGTHTFALEDNILTGNCDFCVVATTVTTGIRRKARMYDREPGEVD